MFARIQDRRQAPTICFILFLALLLGSSDGSAEDLELPIFLTSMIHLEGGTNDDKDIRTFMTTLGYLDDAMNLAEAYGAIQTIETERPFAIGSFRWAPGALNGVLLRGHGVGTHCDVGYPPATTQGDYWIALEGNKALVDYLVGSGNNWGCSGAGSHLDWVVGLARAGFHYVNGVVGMHYLAVDPWNRPPGYFDSEIRNGGLHHNQAPVDLLDRTYLRTLKDAKDMEHDEDGILVFSPGSFGKLQGIAEGAYLSEEDTSGLTVELTPDDVDDLVELIKTIDMERDRSKVSKITIMSHARDWDHKNLKSTVVMGYFLGRMEMLAKDGMIEWAAEKTVVETYLDVMGIELAEPAP